MHGQKEDCSRKAGRAGEVSTRASSRQWKLILMSAHLKIQVTSSMEIIHNQFYTMLFSRRQVTEYVLQFFDD